VSKDATRGMDAGFMFKTKSPEEEATRQRGENTRELLALNWFTAAETRATAQLRGGARGCEQPRWRGGCRTHVRSHVATFNL
jgi:hypothetical protein